MTYADMYDDLLDELFQPTLDTIGPLMGCRVSRLIKDNSPTTYNCGFNDWSDGLSHDKVICSECDRVISADRVADATQEAEVLCGVCAGDEFECDQCGEILPNSEAAEVNGDTCQACIDAEDNEEDEDNEE